MKRAISLLFRIADSHEKKYPHVSRLTSFFLGSDREKIEGTGKKIDRKQHSFTGRKGTTVEAHWSSKAHSNNPDSTNMKLAQEESDTTFIHGPETRRIANGLRKILPRYSHRRVIRGKEEMTSTRRLLPNGEVKTH